MEFPTLLWTLTTAHMVAQSTGYVEPRLIALLILTLALDGYGSCYASYCFHFCISVVSGTAPVKEKRLHFRCDYAQTLQLLFKLFLLPCKLFIKIFPSIIPSITDSFLKSNFCLKIAQNYARG